MSKIERYNYEEAYNESAKMREKIEGGAADYNEAEKLVEKERAGEISGTNNEIKDNHHVQADRILNSEKVPFSREIYLEDGTPEPDHLDQQRQQKIIKYFKEKEGCQNTIEWKEFFNKIDFSLLREIFNEVALSYEVPKEKVNFIGPEGILSHEGAYTNSVYMQEYNLIQLGNPNYTNDHKYLLWADEEKRGDLVCKLNETFGSIDIFRLKQLVHEQVHAVSKNIGRGFVEKNSKSGGGYFLYKQSGFWRVSDRRDEFKSPVYSEGYDIFPLLNEAVVEKLAREIVLKYLESSNWPKVEVAIYKNTLNHHPEKLGGYADQVSLIDSIIKKISSKSNVAEEDIWNFFKKGLFEGEKFEDPDKIKLFKETFGSEFLKQLAYLQHPMFTVSEYQLGEFKEEFNL